MTTAQLWLTFKKKYILILFLPILILSYQLTSLFHKNNTYTNSIFVTFDTDNYVLLANLFQKISDDNIKKHYITDPNVNASAILNSAYQFKITLTSKSLPSLKKSTELIKNEITTAAQKLEPEIKNKCAEGIRLILDKIEGIPTNPKDPNFKEVETSLQLRTKNCINLFRQESNLVDFSLKKSDTRHNKNQINALFIMLNTELNTIPKLKLDPPQLEIGEQLEEPNKVKFKDMVSIILSFFIGILFMTGTVTDSKHHG